MKTEARAPKEFGSASPSDQLHIRLFGEFELMRNGVPLPRMRSRTERWLLALLVLRANRSVERSWLAGLFWPESREAQALNNLRRSLSNLRQVLGDEACRLLTPTQQTVTFDLGDTFCDALVFDTLLARKDLASLQRAVTLYRGSLLPDCDADWAVPERAAREQAFLMALETLADQTRKEGDFPEAIRLLRQILRLDPFRETAQRALLETLAAQGDKAGLTLAYRQLRLHLHDELQTEPSAETKALYRHLQEQVTRTIATPAGGRPSPLPRIPWPVSELVGREAETAEVASLLTVHRLVTLTGSGGIGKTRLSLAVAIRVAADFPDGVWFVDLTAITSPAQVLPTLLRALEVPAGQQSPEDALRAHLRGRRLLLILDNAEHLRDACAAVTASLLEALPDLHVLVTSRVLLGVSGEQVWHVPSLSVPASLPAGATTDNLLRYEGPRLFVTRALAASSAFVLTEQNAPAILQICARLEGIPLALELAAARVASLSPDQIATRLEDAFRLLTPGVRGRKTTPLPRHQTLQALVDWSYDLLSETERTCFQQLSCFVGGWTLEAAEAIFGDTALESLTSLIEQSLIIMKAEPGGQVRYRLLETLRQYGQAKLRETGQETDARLRHRTYFLHLASEAAPALDGAGYDAAMKRLQADYENLLLAFDSYLADMEAGITRDSVPPAQQGLEMARALWRLWHVRGEPAVGRDRLNRLLAHPDNQEGSVLRAGVLNGAAAFAQIQGDFDAASSLLEESLSLFQVHGDKRGEASVRANQAVIFMRLGQMETAEPLLLHTLALQRELGDAHRVALTLANLSLVTRLRGDYVKAGDHLTESLALRRELKDRDGISHALHQLGWLREAQGDLSAARRFHEESLALRRELGNKSEIAASLNDLSQVALNLGDVASAHQLAGESLTLRREIGDPMAIAASLNHLGEILLEEGDSSTARALVEEGLALRRRVGNPTAIGVSLAGLGNVEQAEGNLERAYALHAESLALLRKISHKRGITVVLISCAADCRALERIDEARTFLTESLELSRGAGHRPLMIAALEEFACLALVQKQPERAACLYGGADSLRQSLSFPRKPREQKAYEQSQVKLRAVLTLAARREASSRGTKLELSDAIKIALNATA